MSQTPLRQTILSAQAATGTGTAVNVSTLQDIMLQLAGAGGANLTVKIQGSLAATAPDFSATATAANPWDFVACFDYNDPSAVIVGSDGIAFAANGVKNLLVNVDGLTWLCATVTAHAAGSVSAESLAQTYA